MICCQKDNQYNRIIKRSDKQQNKPLSKKERMILNLFICGNYKEETKEWER